MNRHLPHLDGRLAAAICRKYPRFGPALYPVGAAVVAGLYIGTAKLGIELSVAHGVVTPVWAPSGIALAAVVLLGPQLWPAVAIGALVANATTGTSMPVAAFIAVGNTLGPFVGAALLRAAAFNPRLGRIRDVLALVLLSAALSTTIAATNGATTLWVSGNLSGPTAPNGSSGGAAMRWASWSWRRCFSSGSQRPSGSPVGPSSSRRSPCSVSSPA